MNSDNLITIFCNIDDFCIQFEPDWNAILLSLKTGARDRKRNPALSKIMKILIYFHLSGMKTFKQYYIFFIEQI